MARGKEKARCFGQDLMRGEHAPGRSYAKTTKCDSGGGKMPLDRAKEHLAGLTYGAGHSDSEIDETSGKNLAAGSGTSIFDPVLCELVYRWFAPLGGTVLDPFAGGSVRGIVASRLGLPYYGVDLRAEQIAANREQAGRIARDPQPVWIMGDSVKLPELLPAGFKADLVFSCPPYADLERYSDDPLDLSTMDYPAFLEAYGAIIKASCALLKPNRFACFVVGDVRDRKGFYRGFVSDTAQAFADAGMRLYNDAVLVTAVGSLPIRVGKQFSNGRKLGKTHQNVLIFYNGNPAAIRTDYPKDAEFGNIEEELESPDASDEF